jgi:hypothetical protein
MINIPPERSTPSWPWLSPMSSWSKRESLRPLNPNGWKDVVVDRIKLLESPFHSDDAILLGCYAATTRKGGAFIIYADPISDS